MPREGKRKNEIRIGRGRVVLACLWQDPIPNLDLHLRSRIIIFQGRHSLVIKEISHGNVIYIKVTIANNTVLQIWKLLRE